MRVDGAGFSWICACTTIAPVGVTNIEGCSPSGSTSVWSPKVKLSLLSVCSVSGMLGRVVGADCAVVTVMVSMTTADSNFRMAPRS
jgi:hypothetical protein